MNRLKTIFHPIFVFIGIQIAWIILMAIWINWYLKNRQDFREFAQRIQPDIFASDLNWVILIEGCFLMMVILAGVYLIFVFWNKQARLNRMQSNFVSSVSHELKSPLASLQLYLETMKYHDLSREEMRDFVEIMLRDTDRLSSLIENILEASGSDPQSMQLEFHPVDLEAFLQELLDRYSAQFKEQSCEARLEVETLPKVEMDPRAMTMAFNNLIGNALRYSSPGQPIKVRAWAEGNLCRVSVQDSGIGLSESERKKIFRKFYRVQNADTQNIEGAGLGLFITSEIVKSHGGQVIVESEGKGKGSTFTVSLPLSGVRRSSLMEFFENLISGQHGEKEKTNPAG